MKIINSDCIEAMKQMADNSVDAIVTDPPYELGFMGKSWDSTGIAFNVEVWKEALRVLKPGANLIAFSGSRTYHRMAVAIEDAGFEIRDQIMWVYGSGFPKSMNIGKQLEGWEGWGTALKPAHEPMVLARKPLEGTVVNNVLTYGTGGLNIDGARVGNTVETWPASRSFASGISSGFTEGLEKGKTQSTGDAPAGRWPANFIHDGSDEVVGLFPDTKTGSIKPYTRDKSALNVDLLSGTDAVKKFFDYADSGSAARFFYCAKTSKADRNEGLEGFAEKKQDESRKEGNPGGDNPRNRGLQERANHHPTVKPTELMRYLCKLITPPKGVILDPFMGSGSTGKGAVIEGFDFIGIDQSSEYCEIARARIEHALETLPEFEQEQLL